jgi:uncharacterized protein YjbI with pentapeptide repeats
VLVPGRVAKGRFTGAFLQVQFSTSRSTRVEIQLRRTTGRPEHGRCARLWGASLVYAKLHGASLQLAEMQGAVLVNAHLKRRLLGASCKVPPSTPPRCTGPTSPMHSCKERLWIAQMMGAES